VRGSSDSTTPWLLQHETLLSPPTLISNWLIGTMMRSFSTLGVPVVIE
jgi:hypothetical protein